MHHADRNAHALLVASKNQPKRTRLTPAEKRYIGDYLTANLAIVVAIVLTFGVFGDVLAALFGIPLK